MGEPGEAGAVSSASFARLRVSRTAFLAGSPSLARFGEQTPLRKPPRPLLLSEVTEEGGGVLTTANDMRRKRSHGVCTSPLLLGAGARLQGVRSGKQSPETCIVGKCPTWGRQVGRTTRQKRAFLRDCGITPGAPFCPYPPNPGIPARPGWRLPRVRRGTGGPPRGSPGPRRPGSFGPGSWYSQGARAHPRLL